MWKPGLKDLRFLPEITPQQQLNWNHRLPGTGGLSSCYPSPNSSLGWYNRTGKGKGFGSEATAYSVCQLQPQPSWASALHSGTDSAAPPKVSPVLSTTQGRALSMLAIAARHLPVHALSLQSPSPIGHPSASSPQLPAASPQPPPHPSTQRDFETWVFLFLVCTAPGLSLMLCTPRKASGISLGEQGSN